MRSHRYAILSALLGALTMAALSTAIPPDWLPLYYVVCVAAGSGFYTLGHELDDRRDYR